VRDSASSIPQTIGNSKLPISWLESTDVQSSTNEHHNSRSQIAALFLAAGTSSRFGNGLNKLLLPFGDASKNELVVQCSLRRVLSAGIQHIVIVTGHERERVSQALGYVEHPSATIEWAHNPIYREGEMISSIQAGLRHLLPQRDVVAALVCLGDQPLMPPTIIRRVVHAFQQNCGDIVAPRFQGLRGHPVLLHRRFWEEALALPHGAFLRELLKRHPQAVTPIEVNTDFVLRDVDTPEAYREALALQQLVQVAPLK